MSGALSVQRERERENRVVDCSRARLRLPGEQWVGSFNVRRHDTVPGRSRGRLARERRAAYLFRQGPLLLTLPFEAQRGILDVVRDPGNGLLGFAAARAMRIRVPCKMRLLDAIKWHEGEARVMTHRMRAKGPRSTLPSILLVVLGVWTRRLLICILHGRRLCRREARACLGPRGACRAPLPPLSRSRPRDATASHRPVDHGPRTSSLAERAATIPRPTSAGP